jgi:hypothetical protein
LPVPSAARNAQIDSLRRIAAEYRAPMPDADRIPTTYPPYHTLRVDDLGRLWVERHTAGRTMAFEVYSTTGSLLARLGSAAALPAFRPVRITQDHLYAFEPDDDGVLHLVSWRIEIDGRSR